MWPNIPCEASSRHQSPLILRLWSVTRCSEDDWWWHWIRWWSELSSLSHSLMLITGHYWRLVLVTSIVYSYQTIMIIMIIITLTLNTDCSATSEITLHCTTSAECASVRAPDCGVRAQQWLDPRLCVTVSWALVTGHCWSAMVITDQRKQEQYQPWELILIIHTSTSIFVPVILIFSHASLIQSRPVWVVVALCL